jgi:hypothetical protein
MSNALAPVARQRVFTDLGVVAPGALLNTYIAGTPSTPLGTTSDAAGLVANTNPIVASAGGLFGPIYLVPATAYHMRLTDAAGVLIWDQDPVSVPASGTLAVSGGGTGLAALAPGWGLLLAGATPTGPVQIVAPGGAGSILRSGGAGVAPTWVANGAPIFTQLPPASPGTIDASLGCYFFVGAAIPAYTLNVPINPTPGQKILIEFVASVACVLTLTGGAGGFIFTTTVPSIPAMAAGQGAFIGCMYTPYLSAWRVIALCVG